MSPHYQLLSPSYHDTDRVTAYLRCTRSIDDFDSSRYPFTIATNGSLHFKEQAIFYFCYKDEYDWADPSVAPKIYPPIGTLDDDEDQPRDYSKCNATTLVTRTCRTSTGKGNEFTMQPNELLATSTSAGGGSHMVSTGWLTDIVIASAGLFLSWL